MAKDRLKFRTQIGRRLFHQEVDDNFDALMYYSGPFEGTAGPYQPHEVVRWDGCLWVCLSATDIPPSILDPAWDILSPYPGIGRMSLGADMAGGDDITTDWQDWRYYDTLATYNRGCALAPASGYIRIDSLGIWDIDFQAFFSHNETQQERSFSLRVWNATDLIQLGAAVRFGIARNQSATAINARLRLEVTTNFIYDVLVIQAGEVSGAGGDVTDIVHHGGSIDMLQVSG